MILIVTANPLLESVYVTDHQKTGETHRTKNSFFRAGGKGINISRQLKMLGVPSLNLFPLGGDTGRILRNTLESEQLQIAPVTVKSPVRTGSVIEHPEGKTSYIAPDISLNSVDISTFIDKMGKMIVNAEMVVFAGSVPCPNAAEIYMEGLRLAGRHDKVSLLDTYGPHLQECYNLSPTIVHNTIGEISAITGSAEPDFTAQRGYFESLYNSGIKQTYLTDEAKPFLASNFNYLYRVNPPSVKSIDSTGCGDAFNAGILHGWYHDTPYLETLKLAVKLGALNAKNHSVCKVSVLDIDNFSDEIDIHPAGDKMKLIDDTATFH